MPAPARPRRVQLPPFDREGLLGLPAQASGLVLFAHGSGSGRLSPRNTFVAGELQRAGLATLLFDLLTEAEARDCANVFDIALLAGRLAQATEWAAGLDATRDLPAGYFGASTGAAAALVAAAELGPRIGAVVSRGGRPDLAGDALPRMTAATLLIVGGEDRDVLALNESARRAMRAECRLDIVPGAGHLFEEPGTLDEVVGLARPWFIRHLARQERG